MEVKFGTEEGTEGPLLRAKFHRHRCNVSPLRGEKPQNRPLIKLNSPTGRFALRAMLPVITARRGTDVSCPLLDTRTRPSGQVTSLVQHSAGRLQPKRVRKATIYEFNKQLKRLCSDYVAGQRSMLSFLRSVGETIRFIG